jgi:hypothetical protein
MGTTGPDMVRRTFTLTQRDLDALLAIAAHRHPSDPRVESLTVRELIREEWARIHKEKKEQKEQKR